jgi:hypothetical protein
MRNFKTINENSNNSSIIEQLKEHEYDIRRYRSQKSVSRNQPSYDYSHTSFSSDIGIKNSIFRKLQIEFSWDEEELLFRVGKDSFMCIDMNHITQLLDISKNGFMIQLKSGIIIMAAI